ncbi:MOSC domain-containing protein 2, mitochondrial [Tetrabaena socialis]|uniref:MOSC domain-containing protein 2, mitochondrial n=1 Tax=Tetrabaena socialis TaxID=47790 RepID=A0A2J8A1R5_9CHLO|nr:MOSC domain-containing protein 2, mitochondrial [Tetrabaena socialis]|eukprot:PNH06438.1 MOSC domain-containing protein 2, mitochondrial [Tetrabaena socialis]
MPTIAALNVYPIKSCRGVSLQSAMMTSAGLAYDREWMVVRQETGKFISQREKSLLALVDVALPAEVLSPAQWGTQLSAEAALTVSAPGMPPLKVLMARRPDNEVRKVTVWEWTGAGADEGDDAAAWFSRYLGVAARLVRYLGSGGGVQQQEALPLVRTTEPEFAVDYEVRFSDGYPMLLVTQVTVWEWTGAGADEGDDAAAWFSRYLGVAARLVRYLGSGGGVQQQEVGGAAWPGGGKGGEEAKAKGAKSEALPLVRTTEPEFAVDYEVRFSDGYPMLLVTQSALADLNTKMAEPLPMNRFRPNIEVSGVEPWAEDGWRDIDIACAADGRTVRLTSVKPCSRCKITTTDQATGEVGDEPLETLGTIRSGKVLGWNKDQKSWTHAVFFGWNVVSRTPGVLSVGDVLTVASPQLAVLTPAA